MKTNKSAKSRERRNVVIAMVVIVMALVMFISLPTIILDILLAVNLFLVLAIFLVVVFTGYQLRRQSHKGKVISGETGIFYPSPTVFLLCAIFELAVYVNFTRLILTKAAGADNKIILFFFGLTGAGGIAGITTGFVSIIAICAAVIFTTKKESTHISEAAILALDVMPETMTTMEHAYTCGEISEETFIARKDHLVKQADFLGAMDGAGKFIAGNATVMILIMAAGVFGGISIGTMLHGQTIQKAVETSIAFGISGGIIFLLPLLLLSVAMRIASGCVYEFSLRQLTDAKGMEKL